MMSKPEPLNPLLTGSQQSGDAESVDPLSEIGIFIRVVDNRSFTLAARTLGLTASGVSRAITRLEKRLGVRLLERTTRSVGVTGSYVLGPAIGHFLAMHPELSVDLSLSDRVIDPVAEGVDVVLRMVKLRDSELVLKRLGSLQLVVVGTPAYFERRGRPDSIADLRNHEMLGFLVGAIPLPWKLRNDEGDFDLRPQGRFNSNGIGAILEAARASHGIVQIFERVVRDDIRRRTFEVVLGPELQREVPLVALYTKEKAQLPKVRAFLSFMGDLMSATP